MYNTTHYTNEEQRCRRTWDGKDNKRNSGQREKKSREEERQERRWKDKVVSGVSRTILKDKEWQGAIEKAAEGEIKRAQSKRERQRKWKENKWDRARQKLRVLARGNRSRELCAVGRGAAGLIAALGWVGLREVPSAVLYLYMRAFKKPRLSNTASQNGTKWPPADCTDWWTKGRRECVYLSVVLNLFRLCIVVEGRAPWTCWALWRTERHEGRDESFTKASEHKDGSKLQKKKTSMANIQTWHDMR